MRCRISGRLCQRWNTTTRNVVLLISLRRSQSFGPDSRVKPSLCGDLRGRQRQVGSLAGAAHLLNDNTGVLRSAQWERKSHVEQKGKSWLDFDFQYEYKLGNDGLSILSVFGIWSERCQKSYHRDNWLVAAKRSQRRCFLILRCRLFLSLCRRSHQV